MKKRSVYLDVLKIIAIICVCSYHFSWAGNIEYSQQITFTTAINRFIYELSCVGVPLFFMVNGSLVFSREYTTSQWVKNMAYMVIQLFIWRVITIVVLCKALGVSLLEHGARYALDGMFFGEFEGINLSYQWFIYGLIIVYLLYPFLKVAYDGKKEQSNYLLIFLGILSVLCFATKSWTTLVKVVPFLGGVELENIRSFLGFDGIYGAMLCYFILGGVINKYKEKLKKISWLWLILAFLAAAVSLYIKWLYESQAINATYDSVFWGYDCIAGAVLSISVYLLALKGEDAMDGLPEKIKKITGFFGKNTMGVYYLHWLAGYILLPLCYEAVAVYQGIGLNLLKAIVLVTVCSIVAELLGKLPVVGYLFHTRYRR